MSHLVFSTQEATINPSSFEEDQQQNTSSDMTASLSGPPLTALPSGLTQIYGYHHTFHTHAQVLDIASTSPPSYAFAASKRSQIRNKKMFTINSSSEQLPDYSCSLELEGALALKSEFLSPFTLSTDTKWHDVYAVLRGTQLSLYRPKSTKLLKKPQDPAAGRLIKSYSLQHAEVGIATDFKKTNITPRSALAHLVPSGQWSKLYETDPHLFEPVREHVLRLRVEGEQILLCHQSQTGMLDWVESLCASIDISQPLEDRCEPRYRSLPRRNRRQQVLERGTRLGGAVESEEARARLVAEQERIIQLLFPHLAQGATGPVTEPPSAPDSEDNAEHAEGDQNAEEEIEQHSHNSDPEADDLDPADVLNPSSSSDAAPYHSSLMSIAATSTFLTSPSYNPKTTEPVAPSEAHALRYRRRCAPVLTLDSPRASDVIFREGVRMRINERKLVLDKFDYHPPRYEAHAFPADLAETLAATRAADQHRPAYTRMQSAFSTYTMQESGSDAEHSAASESDATSESSSFHSRKNLTKFLGQGPNAVSSQRSAKGAAADIATRPLANGLPTILF